MAIYVIITTLFQAGSFILALLDYIKTKKAKKQSALDQKDS